MRSKQQFLLGVFSGALLLISGQTIAAEQITHTPNPDPNFPISQSVFVPTGADTLYVSGLLAKPAKLDAPKGHQNSGVILKLRPSQ